MVEHCKISNSKHQTGAPPRGWGLRRRNLRVSGVPPEADQVSGVNIEDSGVGCQVSELIDLNTEH